MTPNNKKLLKPKEVSLDLETPAVELPNEENKLFDEDDDVGISTIPDLSLPGSPQWVKCVGNTDVLCFGFYFMSPKWIRTKIVIEIALLLHVYSCLLLVQAG